MRMFSTLMIVSMLMAFGATSAKAVGSGVCVMFCNDPTPSPSTSTPSTNSYNNSYVYQPSPQEIADNNASYWNQEAIRLRQTGDLETALKYYERALGFGPSFVKTIYNNMALVQNDFGINAYENEDWAAAVKWFEQALANFPGDKVIASNLEGARQQLKYEQDEKRRERQEFAAMETLDNMMSNAAGQLTNIAKNQEGDNSPQLSFIPLAGPSDSGFFNEVGAAAFSSGTSDTAPVSAGSEPGLIAGDVSLPVVASGALSGGMLGAGDARIIRSKQSGLLLSGEAAAVRRQQVRVVSGLTMAQRLIEGGRIDSARHYLETAVATDPECTPCREVLDLINNGNYVVNLEDPYELSRLSMVTGERMSALKVDTLPDAPLDVDGPLITKPQFMLAALDYGADWEEAIAYLEDAQTIYPGNKQIQAAMLEIAEIYSTTLDAEDILK